MRKLLLLILLIGTLVMLTPESSSAASLDGTWRYRTLIDQTAAKYDLPAGMIQAIMSVESGGDPSAYSSAGAIGIMQIMPGWFSWNEDPWDVQTNIDRAGYILQQCKLATGRWWQPGDDWVETINCYLYGHPVYYSTWYSNLVYSQWYIVAEAETHILYYM